jgi:hypothetical protein
MNRRLLYQGTTSFFFGEKNEQPLLYFLVSAPTKISLNLIYCTDMEDLAWKFHLFG